MGSLSTAVPAPLERRRKVRFVGLVGTCVAAVVFTQLQCSRAKREQDHDAALPANAAASSASPRPVSAPTEAQSTIAPSPSRAAEVRSSDAAAPGIKLENPIDLGSPGALVATDRGVIFRTGSDELTGIPLAEAPPRTRGKNARLRDGPGEGAERTSTLRGPPLAFTRSSHAYWVTRGKLVRRAFSWGDAGGGPLEVLASDAQDGVRVAA